MSGTRREISSTGNNKCRTPEERYIVEGIIGLKCRASEERYLVQGIISVGHLKRYI